MYALDDRVPWRPGFLAAGVTRNMPDGAPQNLLMMMVEHARARGSRNIQILERIESAISIADDAIEHMIVTSRIQS